MIKGILFDKDGTLIDIYKVWGTAAGSVMDRLLAGCHMGEREFLKKELLERLGIHDSEIDPEGAFAWMTYREITDVIWNFLKEKHLPVEDELYMDIESIDPESHTIIKLKKEDLKEQQKESKKHTKEKNIEKGNE